MDEATAQLLRQFQEMELERQAMNQRIIEQQEQIGILTCSLQAQSVTSPVVAPTPLSVIRKPEVTHPELFYGDRLKSRTFILQLKIIFKAQPSRFLNDTACVTYAISHLRDAAFNWIEPYLASDNGILTSFSNFEDLYLLYFGDIDRACQAEHKMFSLK